MDVARDAAGRWRHPVRLHRPRPDLPLEAVALFGERPCILHELSHQVAMLWQPRREALRCGWMVLGRRRDERADMSLVSVVIREPRPGLLHPTGRLRTPWLPPDLISCA